MIIEDFIHHKENTLTDSMCTQAVLTDFVSKLYFYMKFLENSNRVAEADLIRNIRGMIVECRSITHITNEDILKTLQTVNVYLNIQITVLSGAKERQWEAELFDTYIQDLATAINYFGRKEIISLLT
jgi:hypothetical protein